jgi:membrane protein DedA with SNARE-associated domain
MLSGLAEWVTDVVERLGYLGVALLVLLENLFPPIPSEVILPFAGFVARDADSVPKLIGMIIAATIGGVVGAWILYGIGYWIGPDRMEHFAVRYGKWVQLTPRDIARAEAWFDRREVLAVLVGRCIPLIRSVVSIPAGFRRMNLFRFTLYTAIGAGIWNTILITAGYLLRDNWDSIEPILDVAQYAVVAAIVGTVGWFVISRRRRIATD